MFDFFAPSFVDGLLLGVTLALFSHWILREKNAKSVPHGNLEDACLVETHIPMTPDLASPAVFPTSLPSPDDCDLTTLSFSTDPLSERIESHPHRNLKSLRNWQQIYLSVVRKSSNWENVAIILSSLTSPPSAGPTMLSIARWKSLCILDVKSHVHGLRRRPRRELGSDLDDDSNSSTDDEEEEEEEELYWRERENLITEGYTSEAARPLTSYFPLQLLKSDQSKGFDVLTCCMPSVTDDAGASHPELQFFRRPSTFEDLDSTLTQLSRVAQEFVETEKLFVRDLAKLILLLNELRYSTLASVREFCQAVPFVGILSSAEVMQTLHSQFLNRILCSPSPLPEDPPTDLVAIDSLCQRILSSLQLYAPFFPLLAQYVAHHDSFSCLYNRYMSSSEEFNDFLGNSERLMGEAMASLVIKPVQRLPRHVLLCNEIRKISTKASEKASNYFRLSSADDLAAYPPDMTDTLSFLTSTCEKACQAISAAAHSCNEIVRSSQDTLRMHELHNQLLSGGSALSSSLPVVVKERRFVKEGDLYRHHKNSFMRLHRIQLFSDVLLSSSPSTTGSSLYLEQQIPLTTGSGTFCIPIPSTSSSLQRDATAGGSCSHWFLLGAQHKNLYFGCRSEAEMMKWVDAIQDCLTRNQAETDHGKFREQLGLINSLLSDIESHRRLLHKTSLCAVSLQEFQTSWWHLLLSSEHSAQPSPSAAGATGSSPASALQRTSRLIHQHAKAVASHLILSVQSDDEADLIEGKSPVQALLFTEKPHFLIATGLFFEFSRSTASLASGERPAVVRVFLFHDLLLAAYCRYVDAPLSYAFHIPLTSLRCADYRQDVGELAILLGDTSRRLTRRRSMLDRLKSFSDDAQQEQQQEIRRVLFAPTLTMKFDWLSLMMQAIAALSAPPDSLSSLPAVRGRISLDLNPLKPLWIEAEAEAQDFTSQQTPSPPAPLSR
jgi:hypothetical protein